MSHEFIKIFWDGEFNMPVVMALEPNASVERLKLWIEAIEVLTDRVMAATNKPLHEIEKVIQFAVDTIPAVIPILFNFDAKNIITTKAGRNKIISPENFLLKRT